MEEYHTNLSWFYKPPSSESQSQNSDSSVQLPTEPFEPVSISISQHNPTTQFGYKAEQLDAPEILTYISMSGQKRLEKISEEVAALNPATSGERRALVLLRIEERLAQKISPSEQLYLENEVVRLFETSSYDESKAMRLMLDNKKGQTSQLFQLVYDHVSPEASQRILLAINQRAQEAYENNKGDFQFFYSIYSDLDDTIMPTLNDRDTQAQGKNGLYPGASELFEGLLGESSSHKMGTRFTALSARPEQMKRLSDFLLSKKLGGIPFHSLYGTGEASLKAIKHYSMGKLAAKTKSEGGKTFAKNTGSEAYSAFAIDKRRNMDRDLLLWPEAIPFMLGDSGEGDFMCMLMKCNGQPTPELLEDPRIPEELKVGDKPWGKERKEEPVNRCDRPLKLFLVHQLTSLEKSAQTSYSSIPNPNEINSGKLSETHNVHLFRNYVDLAEILFNNKILSETPFQAVIEAAKNWLDKDKMTKLSPTSPALSYRQELIESILRIEDKIKK